MSVLRNCRATEAMRSWTCRAFFTVPSHVDHDGDAAGGAAADENLHDGIGVGDGGRLGVVTITTWSAVEVNGENVAADACAGVDDEGVGGLIDGI